MLFRFSVMAVWSCGSFCKLANLMLSAPLKTDANANGVDPAEVQRYFIRHGRYTAGTATRYRPSLITANGIHQDLAKGLEIGTRFHSAAVVRLADAKPLRLGDTLKADGRWRLILFADRQPLAANTRLRALCEFLDQSLASPVRRFTPAPAAIDSVIDVRAVLQDDHRKAALEDVPLFLVPAKGRLGLRDYEKVFCPDTRSGNDIFDRRGIDRREGCMVVVRPDQYIGHVLPLEACSDLAAYFEGFMLPAA